MDKYIFFDMDGTIADLYAVNNWQDKLNCHNVTPYLQANTMNNYNSIIHSLKKAIANGYRIGVITWGSIGSNRKYDDETAQAKKLWLIKNKFPHSEFHFLPYGTPKHTVGSGVLVDDNQEVLADWIADNADNIGIVANKNIAQAIEKLIEE